MEHKSFMLLLLVAIGLSSCSTDDTELDSEENGNVVINTRATLSEKDMYMQQFAKILSCAVKDNRDVRVFLKMHALQRMDNGYNIFYPLVKNNLIGNQTFREVLQKYEGKKGLLDKIESNVPLLNIHMPEFGDVKVENLNVDDEDTPVLYSGKLYYQGAIVDSIGIDEVPGFNVFVVGESGRIELRSEQHVTRSANLNVINSRYEYADVSFSPSIVNHFKTRSYSEYEEVTANNQKCVGNGLAPLSDLDPELIKAYNNSVNAKCAMRLMMYCNMSSLSQTPTNYRSDVTDCVYRFRLSPNGFTDYYKTAQGLGKDGKYDQDMFNSGTSKTGGRMSRDEVIDKLVNDVPFIVKFDIDEILSDNSLTSQTLIFKVAPQDLYNLRIGYKRRHPTGFRKSKNWYWIKYDGVHEKWYYPMDHKQDTRFFRWNLVEGDPIEKYINVSIVSPDDGTEVETTKIYQISRVKEKDKSLTSSFGDLFKIEISNKDKSSVTVTETVTKKYKTTVKSADLGAVKCDYFKDYPIETISGDSAVMNNVFGSGSISVSVVPITNKFYNTKYQNIK